ncbi:MAG: tetratricopeptide repeat protein [Odoribacter sp.]|nr:tetratricopeptide repeat protein [Odoribacter sp.]
MAKKNKEENPQGLKNVEETLTKTERYLEQNYKLLLTILGTVVVLVGIFWLGRLWLNNKSDEAQSQMYQAQRWMEMDSLKLALNGDGNYLGFLDIAKNYKMTKAGNLAIYCAGISYLHLGEYENALEYLTKYRRKDDLIGSVAAGAIGDALVETGELDKGAARYIEAADIANNSFNTPLFLMKAAQIYELQKKYADAMKTYERIQKEYPESTEGTSIEKYIARVKLLVR